MLSRTRAIIGSPLLVAHLKPKYQVNMTSVRGVKGVQLNFRSSLPKYKKILGDLPPLTGPLTNRKPFGDPVKVRSEKLDTYLSYVPMGSNTNLLEAIFKADDVDKLLRIIDENLATMTSFYIGISFEALDDMMRANLCDRATVAVAPEFRHLCSKTIYKMRFFESDEVLKLLKCMATLKVPEDRLIVQALLEMARNHINDFTIKELKTLEESLDEFEPIHKGRESLLLVLKDAIPLAIERQIEEKQYADDDLEEIESFKPAGSIE